VKTLLLFTASFIVSLLPASAQEGSKPLSVSFFAGAMNYQGDLKPNSVTLAHSNFTAGIFLRKPVNRWFSVRAGLNIGGLQAADKWNRDYLKSRNLSFNTDIKEAYAGLELNLLDPADKKFVPYLFGGGAVFKFNPWAYDDNGVKTFLQPLSTEGQGLKQFPSQKPYKLTDYALTFGGGFRVAVSDVLDIGIEFNMRKTFTDYLDDVSSIYVDRNILLQEKGAKSVEMAYRGGQLPQGSPMYPPHSEIRGTPTEKDWYYTGGITFGIKTDAIFNGVLRSRGSVASQRCPRF
jgi:hypothetical protein